MNISTIQDLMPTITGPFGSLFLLVVGIVFLALSLWKAFAIFKETNQALLNSQKQALAECETRCKIQSEEHREFVKMAFERLNNEKRNT